MDKLSVVIPVYKSEGILNKTIDELEKFFGGQNLEYEILLINDGSPDRSWNIIKERAGSNPRILGINLIKNYGQHSAVLCGIQQSSGDYVITMDDDLQNPPSEIIHLYNKVKEGYDVVFGKFPVKRHGPIRKLGTVLINYLNRKIFYKPKGITLSNFRIFTSEVASRISNYRTRFPYIPGLVLLSGNSFANAATEHKAREVGKSNYSLGRIISLMSRLLINYSSYPLKFLTKLGFALSALSFGFGLFYLIKALVFGGTVRGWSSLVVIISFLNGYIILFLGLLGEYVSRVLMELTISEPFLVKEKTG